MTDINVHYDNNVFKTCRVFKESLKSRKKNVLEKLVFGYVVNIE